MGGGGRVVVIGAPALREQLAAALSDADVVLSASPLDGVWTASHDVCSGICVQIAATRHTEPLIRALRQSCPRAPIVTACHPAHEPEARAAIEFGADAYLLLPIDADEARRAFAVELAATSAPRAGPLSDAVPRAEFARVVAALDAQTRECERWRGLALQDDLSGLHNRRHFEQMLERLLTGAGERREPVTLLLFDIDDFKTYNDRFGHAAGDELIREVAGLLRRCTRETDVVARLGGDEFGVIFWEAGEPRQPGSQHPREPMALAERFRTAIAAHEFPCLGPSAPGPVTISGGLAAFPWNATSPAGLRAAADEALLAAKRVGKNRIHLAGAGVERA